MLVLDTQVVHFPAAPVVCYPPALDNGTRKGLSVPRWRGNESPGRGCQLGSVGAGRCLDTG